MNKYDKELLQEFFDIIDKSEDFSETLYQTAIQPEIKEYCKALCKSEAVIIPDYQKNLLDFAAQMAYFTAIRVFKKTLKQYTVKVLKEIDFNYSCNSEMHIGLEKWIKELEQRISSIEANINVSGERNDPL